MRLREQRLWDSFSSNVSSSGLWLQRVENGLIAGMPDVLAIYKGIVSWVELKAIERWPVREMTPVLGDKNGLNVEQRNWHLDWTRAMGRSFILVGVGVGRARTLHMFHGVTADQVNGWHRKAFLSAQLNWDAVRKILTA